MALLPAFSASNHAASLLGTLWGISGSNARPFIPSGWTWSVDGTGLIAGKMGGKRFSELYRVLRDEAARHCNAGGVKTRRLTVSVEGRKPGVIRCHIG